MPLVVWKVYRGKNFVITPHFSYLEFAPKIVVLPHYNISLKKPQSLYFNILQLLALTLDIHCNYWQHLGVQEPYFEFMNFFFCFLYHKYKVFRWSKGIHLYGNNLLWKGYRSKTACAKLSIISWITKLHDFHGFETRVKGRKVCCKWEM